MKLIEGSQTLPSEAVWSAVVSLFSLSPSPKVLLWGRGKCYPLTQVRSASRNHSHNLTSCLARLIPRPDSVARSAWSWQSKRRVHLLGSEQDSRARVIVFLGSDVGLTGKSQPVHADTLKGQSRPHGGIES